jgi:hypothetical protein
VTTVGAAGRAGSASAEVAERAGDGGGCVAGVIRRASLDRIHRRYDDPLTGTQFAWYWKLYTGSPARPGAAVFAARCGGGTRWDVAASS